jgi:hypothetical protein
MVGARRTNAVVVVVRVGPRKLVTPKARLDPSGRKKDLGPGER